MSASGMRQRLHHNTRSPASQTGEGRKASLRPTRMAGRDEVGLKPEVTS